MIAAVEIHKEMIIEKYASEFNYDTIKNKILRKNGFSVLNINDKKALSIFSSQINDYEFEYKTVNLKNAYDFLLLNNKDSGTDFIFKFNKLRNPIMCFIASLNYMFEEIIHDIDYNQKVKEYMILFKSLIQSPIKRKLYTNIITTKLFIIDRAKIIFKSFKSKEYRVWLFKRLSDKQWQKEKLGKFNLKNLLNK